MIILLGFRTVVGVETKMEELSLFCRCFCLSQSCVCVFFFFFFQFKKFQITSHADVDKKRSILFFLKIPKHSLKVCFKSFFKHLQTIKNMTSLECNINIFCSYTLLLKLKKKLISINTTKNSISVLFFIFE